MPKIQYLVVFNVIYPPITTQVIFFFFFGKFCPLQLLSALSDIMAYYKSHYEGAENEELRVENEELRASTNTAVSFICTRVLF